MLIEAQANLEVADNVAGHTPLHVAVSSGFTQGVELLIRAKANIEAKAKLDFKARDTSPQDPGNTPLHIAVLLGFTQVVEMLIEAKANIEATSAAGLTPLGLAGRDNKDGDKAAVIAVLRKHGASSGQGSEGRP